MAAPEIRILSVESSGSIATKAGAMEFLMPDLALNVPIKIKAAALIITLASKKSPGIFGSYMLMYRRAWTPGHWSAITSSVMEGDPSDVNNWKCAQATAPCAFMGDPKETTAAMEMYASLVTLMAGATLFNDESRPVGYVFATSTSDSPIEFDKIAPHILL